MGNLKLQQLEGCIKGGTAFETVPRLPPVFVAKVQETLILLLAQAANSVCDPGHVFLLLVVFLWQEYEGTSSEVGVAILLSVLTSFDGGAVERQGGFFKALV